MMGQIRKHIFLFLLLFVSMTTMAQDGIADSIVVLSTDSIRSSSDISVSSPTFKPLYYPRASFNKTHSIGDSRSINPALFASTTPGVANLVSWDNGAIMAYGGSASYSGLLGVESGGLRFGQNLGDFTLNLDASATKYAYFRGLSNSYGLGGSLSYKISDNIGLTLFGSYQSNAGLYQPAMFDLVGVSRLGGYFDIRINDTWGFMVGAQSYHSLSGGYWETQPMLVPYVNLGGIEPIGVDLGGILYQLLRTNVNKKSNPTISPPVGSPPPIRPR